MTNKEAISAFYSKALTVNIETRPTEVLTPILTEDFLSSGSVASKNKDQLMGQLEFFWNFVNCFFFNSYYKLFQMVS
jgi:hypothetical protein